MKRKIDYYQKGYSAERETKRNRVDGSKRNISERCIRDDDLQRIKDLIIDILNRYYDQRDNKERGGDRVQVAQVAPVLFRAAHIGNTGGCLADNNQIPLQVQAIRVSQENELNEDENAKMDAQSLENEYNCISPPSINMLIKSINRRIG